MTDDFLKLRIIRIYSETSDTKSYFLEPVDGRPVPHRAGQFLTLILQHGGHEVRRSYSLSSAAHEPLRLTIKRVENGAISRYLLNTLRVGDELKSLYPAGRFIVDSTAPGDLALLGAGSGITPLFSIIKEVLRAEPNRRITLLYSSPSERAIIFRTELDELQKQYPDRFRLIYLLSNPSDDWNGLRGRLNNVMLERLLPELVGTSDPKTLQFYICGPGDYMRMAQFTIVFSGFRPDQIRREDFVIKPVVLTPPPALAQDRTILLRIGRREGEPREVEIQVPAYKSILQAALDEGIHLPYSCRGGRCSTCVARCTSGSVHMTINDVLTERDLSEGWMLTCTGYPESDGVVIEV
ncbi:ferredoxin--NADP reductase [Spirosoma fluviale]|uniref:Ring-1,2-phenylacetyl-CoA epoxidase subunit PaaE n=1 Tax=Spirosoma fluviale TaxID=1597977 RepID=A0A286FXX2_9BACT|nr:ferredoxin--NADP reductase [Spirosoma fluviale]SOD88093.1 ring-1,2-phenylacetyl-CoA epoxidase subunit PaaE [Spirosoma fluviale]